MGVVRIFAVVTAGALFGMLLGGAFGWAAGSLAPEPFVRLFPFGPPIQNPVGAALMIGAFGGVLCGGGLTVFALVLTRVDAWLRGRSAV